MYLIIIHKRHYIDEPLPEEYKTIKKDLKALEIINDKNVNVAFLKALINKNFSVVEYNISSNTGLFLTSDEFNFLKEVLCKD